MWSILWIVCFSTYLCAQFNMVSEPQRTRKFSFFDLLLDHFLAKLLLPSMHQKHKVYHLIPQVKELLIKLDQLCWVWWKAEMCRMLTLWCPFCVFVGTTSNGFINSGFISSSSHTIHKRFTMEDEDDCLFEETRSLWGVYWTWWRVLWERGWLAKWMWCSLWNNVYGPFS